VTARFLSKKPSASREAESSTGSRQKTFVAERRRKTRKSVLGGGKERNEEQEKRAIRADTIAGTTCPVGGQGGKHGK